MLSGLNSIENGGDLKTLHIDFSCPNAVGLHALIRRKTSPRENPAKVQLAQSLFGDT